MTSTLSLSLRDPSNHVTKHLIAFPINDGIHKRTNFLTDHHKQKKKKRIKSLKEFRCMYQPHSSSLSICLPHCNFSLSFSLSLSLFFLSLNHNCKILALNKFYLDPRIAFDTLFCCILSRLNF